LVTLATTTVPCDWSAAVMAHQITAADQPVGVVRSPAVRRGGPHRRCGRVQSGVGRVRVR
jgi:hypothetical protein